MTNSLKKLEKRQTHNYTSELELKSLLIRIKNDRYELGKYDLNERINARIKLHTALGELDLSPDISPERNALRRRIYQNVVKLSEQTRVDYDSYERFGEIILLMIQRILTRPNFSGYSYRHDFYSDAVYKVIKYLHNFDHNLTSKRTGLPVNAFAYISQYIHNSVIYIIGKHKKENDALSAIVKSSNSSMGPKVLTMDTMESKDNFERNRESAEVIDIVLSNVTSLKDEIRGIIEYLDSETPNIIEDFNVFNEFDDFSIFDEFNDPNDPNSTNTLRFNIIYPSDYVITFEEYSEMRDLMKPNINIVRGKE